MGSIAPRACLSLQPILRKSESCCIVLSSFFSITYVMNDNLKSSRGAGTFSSREVGSMNLHASTRQRWESRRRSAQRSVDGLSSRCLPCRVSRADGSFNSERLTSTSMRSKPQADRPAKTNARPMGSIVSTTQKMVRPAPKNFFSNPSQLAKKPHGTFWKFEIRGYLESLLPRIGNEARRTSEALESKITESRFLACASGFNDREPRQTYGIAFQVVGGGTYSTRIRTTLPLLIRWTTS